MCIVKGEKMKKVNKPRGIREITVFQIGTDVRPAGDADVLDFRKKLEDAISTGKPIITNYNVHYFNVTVD
jgi:hypothetical protein